MNNIENNIVISLENVSKVFYDLKKGAFTALSDISFSCKKGEIVGLVGPNGAGKTTLLRIISSLISPTSGTVKVNGLDNSNHGEKNKKDIGFLSSDTAIYERLTGKELLLFFADLYGMKKDLALERIDELSQILDFKKIENRVCKNLSTGEKQKISIARALINDPNILILDEATNGLDILARKHILWLVKSAKEKGKTVLYSAHAMDEIEKLSDRIIFLYHGKLISNGSTDDLKNKFQCDDLTQCFLKNIEQYEKNNDEYNKNL